MNDYIEELLSEPQDCNVYYPGDAVEADLHEEDELDEYGAL